MQLPRLGFFVYLNFFVKFWCYLVETKTENYQNLALPEQGKLDALHTRFLLRSENFDGFLRKKIKMT